ncbi:MAG: type II toxin-antitoxin system HicB family antitoxin [Chromatiaceae bacterium]
MHFTVETEQEVDGRWIAEIVEIPGALKYGDTKEQAVAQAEALALRVLAERIESGEQLVEPIQISFEAA